MNSLAAQVYDREDESDYQTANAVPTTCSNPVG
jgi:hypothetical protein